MASKVMNIRMTQTKQSIMGAFISLVSQKDFEKITISDITTAAHVNRATFYAHFNDKYALLDHIMGDSASNAILSRTSGVVKFDQNSITQLVLAVCDFYQPPEIQCRSSYVGVVIPQLKEKIISELNVYLSKSLESIAADGEKNMYVPIVAQAIHEGAFQWASGNVTMNKEEVAKRVSVFITEGVSNILTNA